MQASGQEVRTTLTIGNEQIINSAPQYSKYCANTSPGIQLRALIYRYYYASKAASSVRPMSLIYLFGMSSPGNNLRLR